MGTVHNATAPTTHAGFLDLAAELRNHIYEQHFAGNEEYVAYNMPDEAPPLLFTNKQIHNEATTIFYHKSTFYINHEIDLDWLTQIPVAYKELVSNIKILVYCAGSLNGAGSDGKRWVRHFGTHARFFGAPLRPGVLRMHFGNVRKAIWAVESGELVDETGLDFNSAFDRMQEAHRRRIQVYGASRIEERRRAMGLLPFDHD